MIESIGMFVGLIAICLFLALLGILIAGAAWLLFWGRPRPKVLIFRTALTPIASLGYLIFCAICFAILVPHQPDLFFGDFSEPLPNGYVLTGLAKMPEFAFFESTPPMAHQPPMRGGVRRLELDGQVVYGAYGHIDDESLSDPDHDHGYFVFDTRTGDVTNLNTVEQLNAAAGHPVHLVESQYFRSQEPGRILLRRIENYILFGPPIVVFLYFLYRLIRFRIKGGELGKPRAQWNGSLGLGA
jgi:hypothetical protein